MRQNSSKRWELLQHASTMKRLPVAVALRISSLDRIRREQEALATATSIEEVRFAEARAAVIFPAVDAVTDAMEGIDFSASSWRVAFGWATSINYWAS